MARSCRCPTCPKTDSTSRRGRIVLIAGPTVDPTVVPIVQPAALTTTGWTFAYPTCPNVGSTICPCLFPCPYPTYRPCRSDRAFRVASPLRCASLSLPRRNRRRPGCLPPWRNSPSPRLPLLRVIVPWIPLEPPLIDTTQPQPVKTSSRYFDTSTASSTCCDICRGGHVARQTAGCLAVIAPSVCRTAPTCRARRRDRKDTASRHRPRAPNTPGSRSARRNRSASD